MDGNPAICYIFDGFMSLENSLNSKIGCLNISLDINFIVFNSSLKLVFVENKTNTGSRSIFQEMVRRKKWKELFSWKTMKKNVNYHEISFPEQIVDFCFNEDLFFVLTSGSCLCFLLKDLLERFSSISRKSTDFEDVFDDLLCPVKRLPETSHVDFSELSPITIIQKLNGKKISCRKSSMYVLFDDSSHLSLHLFDVKVQQSKPIVSNCSGKHFLSMSPSNDMTGNVCLFAMTCNDLVNSITLFFTISHQQHLDTDILISSKLFKCLCDEHEMIRGSLGVILCSNSHVMYASLDKRFWREPKILYSLEQPVLSAFCISIKEVYFDDSAAALPYEKAAESHMKQKVALFKESLTENNCLVIIGVHGKVVFITSDNDDNSIQYHVEHVTYPITACTSTSDIIILSNSSQILLYKVMQKAYHLYEYEKQVTRVVTFSLECGLINTVPIYGVQSMCIIPNSFVTIVCLNSKQKILKVTFDNTELSSKWRKISSGDLLTNISKLEDVNTQLKGLREDSEKLNRILHEVKMATSICYQLKQKQSTGASKDKRFDVLVELQRITFESKRALLVLCSFKNNSDMSFTKGWSMTVKYCNNHCKQELDDSFSRKCQIENLPFCTSSYGQFDFSFVISWSWLSYVGITLNFYLNFVPCEDFFSHTSCASIFLKSHLIDVLSMCEIVDGPGLNEREHAISRSDTFIKGMTLSHHVWNRSSNTKFCSCIILTEHHIKFMQNQSAVDDMDIKVESSVDRFGLFMNFLTNITKVTTNHACVVQLVHLNGAKIELAMKEDVPGTCNLILTSKSIAFIISVLVIIKTKFKSCTSKKGRDKEDCENNLKVLKELLLQCDALKKQFSKTTISTREENKIYSDLLGIYLALRSNSQQRESCMSKDVFTNIQDT